MPEGRIDVLLIDDDEDDYFLTKELFSELPPGEYHLDRVADYKSALHALDHCFHDVYLVDYRLGQHSGLELLGEALKRGCTAPMIMLTGQREHEVDLQAMHAGAVDYLIKGQFDAIELERTMRYALQQKRHEETIRNVNLQLEERVHDRTAELAQLNESLQGEIAERQRAEAALREADRRKDEFLAVLGHELRNPLASLYSALALLQFDGADAKQVEQLHGVMSRQVEQLVRLIDDLLDVSRVSRGKLLLKQEHVLLQDVINSAVEVGRPLIESSQHQLHVQFSDPNLVIHGDKLRLTQVVSNLLVNAAKYTPAGGKIELTTHGSQGHVVIRVRDNGLGIPREMLHQIFGMFTQVDSSKTRSHGGLGIGLTLVKTLVELHGGTVSADSEGAGKGSEFTVRLPSVLPKSTGGLGATGDDLADKPLPVLRILIVDDTESAAHLLSRLLAKLGQQVEAANSGTAALELLRAIKPDVIISDIGMPDMSGYELAQRIRAQPEFKNMTLVALTGYGQESDRDEAIAAGFNQHLTKPVGVATLKELVRNVGNAKRSENSGQG